MCQAWARTLIGLSRYQIRRDGVVTRLIVKPLKKTHFEYVFNVMKTRLNDEGYVKVKLTGDDGKRKDYFVHRLVAQAFLPPPTVEQTQVCHKKGRTDNHADNLKWGTHADNHKDKVECGTHKRGAVRKLTDKDVRNIRRAKSGAAKIAKRKGLSISHVRDIRNGRRHGR